MGTNAEKRARQRANREYAATEQPGRRGPLVVVALVVLVGLVAGLVWAFASGGDDTGSDGDTEAVADGADPGAAADPTSTTPAPDGEPAPTVQADGTTSTACPPPERSSERHSTFEAPPEMCIDPATTSYSAEVDTTLGTFTIELDALRAPVTVNNFVVLSRYRYYEDVPFHRVVPGFVIQAGDGDGTPDGSNDVGYTIPDELPPSAEDYVDYSVAMANRGPDTGATQFFVVLPGGGAQLTNAYSLFGQVTRGTEVVDAIGELGGADQTPTSEVLINDVRIVESPIEP